MSASARNAANGLKLIIHNVPWTADRAILQKHFAQFGKVTAISRPFNKDTGFFKSFAFVKMNRQSDVDRVLEEPEHIIDDTRVYVNISEERFSNRKD